MAKKVNRDGRTLSNKGLRLRSVMSTLRSRAVSEKAFNLLSVAGVINDDIMTRRHA